MNVLEMLNAYPGETFIGEHVKAIGENGKVRLTLGYIQTGKVGKLSNAWPGVTESIALLNPNRASRWDKVKVKARYFNHPSSYQNFFEKQIQQCNPDIVHFQFASLAVKYHKRLSQLQIPFTFSVRGSDVQTDTLVGGNVYVKELGETVREAKAIHAVTDDLKEVLFKFCGTNTKTTVIRTCVSKAWADVERKPRAGQLISVGRLHWRKGYADLLLACRLLKEKGLSFNLKIIGSGPEEQKLRFMIRDLALQEYITMVNGKDHTFIRKELESAQGYVLSSLYEGFPNVLAEAMLARVPIVTTALPGVREVIDEDMAFLADTGSPESLSRAMEALLTSSREVLAGKIGKAYSKAVEEFMPENHAEKFNSFWR